MLDEDERIWSALAAKQPVATRMLALRELGKDERKTQRRVDRVCALLRDDPNPIIRHDAAFVLGAMLADEAVDTLAVAASSDESFLVRHESLESLAFLSALPSAVAAITRGIADAHQDVRETAAMARHYQSALPANVTSSALGDLTLPIHLRWAAAFELLNEHLTGRAENAAALFARCLRSDSSPFLRHTAAFMLEEVGGASAWDDLARAALEDASPLVRHEAIETLGFLPPSPSGLSLLERLVRDDDPTVALTARVALEINALRAANNPTRKESVQ